MRIKVKIEIEGACGNENAGTYKGNVRAEFEGHNGKITLDVVTKRAIEEAEKLIEQIEEELKKSKLDNRIERK